MTNKSMLRGLPQLDVRVDTMRVGCQYDKAYQILYKKSKFKAKTDVFRYIKQSSISGMRYMVTFIDDSPGISRFFHEKKIDTFSKFQKFRDITEREVERRFTFYE